MQVLSTQKIDLNPLLKSLGEQAGISAAVLNSIQQDIDQKVNAVAQYTDFHLKPDTRAELQTELQLTCDQYKFPHVDEIYQEALKQAEELATSPKNRPRSFWFVGAAYGREDQTQRFLDEGIWQNGYEDKQLDLVNSMQPGDLIAIKSAYTRKRGLPFDNREQTISVMGIKVVGVIKKNRGDGRFVDVDWQPRFENTREWYFYTYRGTIWRVTPDNWDSEGLIDFAFHDKSQDIDRFRNSPQWKDRFGDALTDRQRFEWTPFYEAVADKLLGYKDDREPLLNFVNSLAGELNLSYIKDKDLDDICPFTTIGLFNRGITDTNRIKLKKGSFPAAELTLNSHNKASKPLSRLNKMSTANSRLVEKTADLFRPVRTPQYGGTAWFYYTTARYPSSGFYPLTD